MLPDEQIIEGRRFVPMLSPEEIADGVRRVAGAIEKGRNRWEGEPDRPPLLLCILKGASIFFADLLRQLSFPVTIDFLQVSSYGDRMTSSGSLTFTLLPGTPLQGRNVIIVEDIVDTGRTVTALREWLQREGAVSVEVASLLYKPSKLSAEEPDRGSLRVDGASLSTSRDSGQDRSDSEWESNPAIPEYFAFKIPDRFVVGYGLDFAEEGRDLSGIYVLADEVTEEGAF